MTVPGVARHVPGTQPHTSGDLGGEGEGGERPTTHTSAHTAHGARTVALLWPGPKGSTRTTAHCHVMWLLATIHNKCRVQVLDEEQG